MADSTLADEPPPTAVLLNPSMGPLTSTLRIAPLRSRGQLMYSFQSEYRAWLQVIQLRERDRPPMTIARLVLLQALLELCAHSERPPENRAELDERLAAENAARAATPRRRAWMTVNGRRLLGVGVDGEEYRAIAIRIDDRLVVVVAPKDDEEVRVIISQQSPEKSTCSQDP